MRKLRIFYAAHPSPNVLAFPDSQVWHQNLFMPLVDLGHDVVPFEYDLTPIFRNLDLEDPRQRAFVEEHRPALERELLRQVEAAHRERPIDVFFSYFYSACARPDTIRAIHDLGITTVNWYCNASYQLHLVAEIAPAYDFCLVPEEFRLEDYRRLGANPVYCQEAANPNVYHPYDLPREYHVVFVGARYGERPAHVRRLIEAGIHARVFGPGWLPTPTALPRGELWRRRLALMATPRGWRLAACRLGLASAAPATPDGIPRAACGPALSDDEMVRMYSRAKISLGFSAVGAGGTSGGERIVQVRLRDFEAPMSGAFYMVEYFPEIERFFEPDKEIVCYASADDLVDKARYYLSHADERERIREAGHARALRDHTWQKRFADAFAEMGLA